MAGAAVVSDNKPIFRSRTAVMAFQARWGILGTGWIAEKYVRDLLIDPRLRDAHDVEHIVTAVGSSTSDAKAQQFIQAAGIKTSCASYGSYEELVRDENVDIVYIATPHSHHFQNIMLALHAKKHVVCEKTLTVNAAQAAVVFETAKQNQRFLLDAVWTRFFPLSRQVRDVIQSGTIGQVLRVVADTSGGQDPDEVWKETPRKLDKALAGGALLELGIYSLIWIFQSLYHTLPKEHRKEPLSVQSSFSTYPRTGVDEEGAVLITFPTGTPSNSTISQSRGIATTGFRLGADIYKGDFVTAAVRIQGTAGEIQVDGPTWRPTCYRVRHFKSLSEPRLTQEFECPFPGDGHGMYWEADEAARCVRDGKLESDVLPWEESLLIIKVMDTIRQQANIVYPDHIETSVYSPEGWKGGR